MALMGSASERDGTMAKQAETLFGVSSWMVCSVGMMVFNKFAISAFPYPCTLTALQMFVSVVALLIFTGRSIRIGSARDVLRWSLIVPFFCGMLLTSMFALKDAPMTLVVVFRCLSPLFSLVIEQFYPSPLRINKETVFCIGLMIAGSLTYSSQLQADSWRGISWVMLNMLLAICDRLLQRLMLAKDQHPVDISLTGCVLLNSLLGLVPMTAAVFLTGESSQAPSALKALLSHAGTGSFTVVASCIVSVGISYTGVWAQTLISATSFLVLVNANKFVIILAEAFLMQQRVLNTVQLFGAVTTVLGGVLYGKVRQAMEAEAAKGRKDGIEVAQESTALLASKKSAEEPASA
eukprot:TRINITY_DN47958_c0_g1_i1.p1 TRINITY_DN47958_c0_g1~~TRINITY_DN47958_c0_g1_i1.p1  ORF type:complete len:359 (+),score=81.45 TRINITY_DN47958_c0_g1_i1:28-1077(+)